MPYGLNRGRQMSNFDTGTSDASKKEVAKYNIDLRVRDLVDLSAALDELNKLKMAVTLERFVCGNNVVQVKKDSGEYMIVGIWPAGNKEGVVRQ